MSPFFTVCVSVTRTSRIVPPTSGVIWAISTRVDPARDSMLVENTPIDYLDFASPVSGLGSKMGMDATNKWPGETQREWGRPMHMTPEVSARAEALMKGLGL